MIINMLADLQGRSFAMPDEQQLLERAGVQLAHSNGASPAQLAWIGKTFQRVWADEAAAGHNWFAGTAAGLEVGFATYEQRKLRWWWLEAWLQQPDVGIFGPMGVNRSMRGKHLGALLLRRALTSLQELGFKRVLIPAVGPIDFYRRWCGAEVVERLKRPLL